MRYLLLMALFLVLLSGCVDEEKMKSEIKQEVREELKKEIMAELEETGRLVNPEVFVEKKKRSKTKEDWEIEYKRVSHETFNNLEFVLPNDPGHTVLISIEFKHHRKFRRAFSQIMSNKDAIIDGIEKILSTKTLDDLSNPDFSEVELPQKILELVNRYMENLQIEEVIITQLVAR